MKKIIIFLLLVLALVAAGGYISRSAASRTLAITAPTPIQHVVIVYQENHSFDNVLGALCVADSRCDGTTQGKLPGGTVLPLGQASDLVPNIDHDSLSQNKAIDGGAMDGFSKISGCKKAAYRCMTQFQPSQIPNLAALARGFVISDRTFEMDTIPSWGAHMELASGTLDGFVPAGNPVQGTSGKKGKGWGCDSFRDVPWGSTAQMVPSCVPAADGSGPYKSSPVPYVPTVMDRLDAAGLSWKIYKGNYDWAVCPTFAECLNGTQHLQMVDNGNFAADAAAGKLPNLSIVTPSQNDSQHNNQSMLQGDNWIESVVSSVMNGPAWNSTAIFVTWDDCGCFYDHVPPPAGAGIRVPMVIVSPYAKPGYTDSTTATFASMLAFVEHNFGLSSLGQADASAYDYAGSFDFGQTPLKPLHNLAIHAVPAWELQWIADHPDPGEGT